MYNVYYRYNTNSMKNLKFFENKIKKSKFENKNKVKEIKLGFAVEQYQKLFVNVFESFGEIKLLTKREKYINSQKT